LRIVLIVSKTAFSGKNRRTIGIFPYMLNRFARIAAATPNAISH
jgi:hypothetical protein